MQKFILPYALSAVLVLSASLSRAQTPYSTDFTGYNPDNLAGTPTGTNNSFGWQTNDPENDSAGGTINGTNYYVGASNYVSTANNGSASGGPTYQNFSGNAASIGGNIRNTTPGGVVVPGQATSTLYHTTTLTPPAGQGYQFQVDAALLVQTGNTLTDSFAFSLTNGASPLLTIGFIPSTTANLAAFTSSLAGATPTPSGNGTTLNTGFRLTIQINPVAGTYNAFYTQNGVQAGISSGTLNTAQLTLAGQVDRSEAQWTLANQTKTNGAYTNASTDTLAFDNYGFSYYTPVPEPATNLIVGAGLVLLVGVYVRRLRCQA